YERAASPELDWLLGAALAKYRAKLTYPAAVARRCGPAALVDEPPVTIGTIHSAKGAEADLVYLSPSLSGAAYQQWSLGDEGRDEIVRQFYVGLTRARESCIVLGSRERCVPVSLLCPNGLIRR
ncbi:MAG: 3'-5' exonuclease, partial [Pseudonocardiaceae bacterium]